MPTFLTRRVAFAAAHRYRIAEWSDARNAAAFGPCARPNYHGHSYLCDVTVTGALDAVTGFVVDLAVLDRVLQSEVRDRFDHANINLDVPEFADGGLMPTGENLADDELRAGTLLGDRAVPLTDESEHLADAPESELYGTSDLHASLEQGVSWSPPDSPTPEGMLGTDAGPEDMGGQH